MVRKLIILMFMNLSCTTLATKEGVNMNFESPFHFENDDEPVQKKVLVSIHEAEEDYRLALSGKPPAFAVLDEEAGMSTDGGTEYWIGKRYKLTILRSLVDIGNVSGYLYGPILTFDPSILSGNRNTISHVEFYTDKAMKKLEEGKSQMKSK